jgi:hypothetical protein
MAVGERRESAQGRHRSLNKLGFARCRHSARSAASLAGPATIGERQSSRVIKPERLDQIGQEES